MEITPCNPYHAISAGHKRLRMPDGKSVYKVYYLSIPGRSNPDLHEWKESSFTRKDFETRFLAGGFEGIGFVTAFPHITKVYRFSPAVETVLDVAEFETRSLQRKDVTRADGWREFACYAEAIIAAGEFEAWAKSTSVDAYLKIQCRWEDFPIVSHTKLADYWKIPVDNER